MTTLIKNVFLNNKQQDILISGDRFTKIADYIEYPSADIVIDGTDKAITPSFYNTHTHAAMMFLRGVGEDKELFSWLNDEIWPREAKLTPELVYHFSRFAILEMIKTGTTFFSDMYFHQDETVKAVDEMGIRAAISAVGMDFFDKGKTVSEKQKMQQFLSAPSPCDRIIKGISCHSVYTASPELLRYANDLTNKHNTFLHIHASETNKEVKDCVEKYKVRPITLLHKLGILGKKTLLAHCLHLDEYEIHLMAKSGTVVCHCPSASLKLNSGQMPMQRFLNKGVHITLGTDGVASNNSLSILSEMKVAALSAKNKAHSITAGKVNDIFNEATVNAAQAFGIDGGEIKEGKVADFLLIDLNNHLLLPTNNLVSNLIYAADSSCITDVFCAGKPVMTDRKVKNEQEIVTEFKKACNFFA